MIILSQKIVIIKKTFMAYCGGKGELYKFSCILEKMCYIKYDEGVHCGAQPGGIRPSSFFYKLKNLQIAEFLFIHLKELILLVL